MYSENFYAFISQEVIFFVSQSATFTFFRTPPISAISHLSGLGPEKVKKDLI